jgi:hypothetical protein
MNLVNQQFGFDREHVAVIGIDPILSRYDYARLAPLYQQIYSRLNAIESCLSALL